MAAADVLIPLIAIGLLVFSLIDVITIEESRVRAMPKWAWAILIVLVTIVGPLLWIFLGREPNPRSAEGGRRVKGLAAPDDDPEFLSRLQRERAQQDRIRELEERLGELDDDGK